MGASASASVYMCVYLCVCVCMCVFQDKREKEWGEAQSIHISSQPFECSQNHTAPSTNSVPLKTISRAINSQRKKKLWQNANNKGPGVKQKRDARRKRCVNFIKRIRLETCGDLMKSGRTIPVLIYITAAETARGDNGPKRMGKTCQNAIWALWWQRSREERAWIWVDVCQKNDGFRWICLDDHFFTMPVHHCDFFLMDLGGQKSCIFGVLFLDLFHEALRWLEVSLFEIGHISYSCTRSWGHTCRQSQIRLPTNCLT